MKRVGFILTTFSYFYFMANCTIGCGGSPAQPVSPPPKINPPMIPITISLQPISQSEPPGATATFQVAAVSADEPLTYQWQKNGVNIDGATEATYTTHPVPTATGTNTFAGKYQVLITNSTGTITSQSVSLTLGPRSPKAGDIRYLLFSQVDLPGFVQVGLQFLSYNGESAIDFGGDIISENPDNALGSPLEISGQILENCSPTTCAWGSVIYPLPQSLTGFNMMYKAGNYPYLQSDLATDAQPNIVFSSLDIDAANSVFGPGDHNVYGLAWVQTEQPLSGSLEYKLETVPTAQIQATVAADGAESRIVTATSFDPNGNAVLISYGWTGDTTTIYEAKTALVSGDQICSTATNLAQEGYFISAFGGNVTSGFLIVGMRVQGDTLPRATTQPNNGPPYITPVLFYYPFGRINMCWFFEG